VEQLMAGILGGGSAGKASVKPAYTGLQLQTSANGLAIPIVYGQAKLAPNVIWHCAKGRSRPSPPSGPTRPPRRWPRSI
jgi:hypothetical protein